ncbi:hypothetical protein F4778DRAFT_43959 [Xylariomycetidae sp. FL2044]|nr:hypothetical protein F4778DRAFT_43959 [Xylariomycetidae sp. FL2044]
MAQPSIDAQAKVASEAAQNFIDHYYDSLNRRHTLSSYYASSSNLLTSASVKPDISINGHVLSSPAEYENLLNTQGGPVSYEVISWDVHPVNPDFRIGYPDSLLGGKKSGDFKGEKLSFAIQVSGTVKYGKGNVKGGETTTTTNTTTTAATDGKNGDSVGVREVAFNESWLLVPHWEAWSPKAARGLRKWVVVSQNFRAL